MGFTIHPKTGVDRKRLTRRDTSIAWGTNARIDQLWPLELILHSRHINDEEATVKVRCPSNEATNSNYQITTHASYACEPVQYSVVCAPTLHQSKRGHKVVVRGRARNFVCGSKHCVAQWTLQLKHLRCFKVNPSTKMGLILACPVSTEASMSETRLQQGASIIQASLSSTSTTHSALYPCPT